MRLPTLLLAAAVTTVPLPAFAQHAGHRDHDEKTSSPAADPHTVHAALPAESHPSHTAEVDRDPDATGSTEPHAGHAQPEGIDAVPSHAAPGTGSTAPPPIDGPPPEAFAGPIQAADAYFGETAMARARSELVRMHGAVPAYRVLVDRFEARLHEGSASYLFDAQAWYGGDIDKLWIKAEGEGAVEGIFDDVKLQALWSHAVGPWFDLQTGLRYDAQDGPDRGHFVVGIEGLAPYWIEIDAAAFLSDRGELTATVEAEHDVRITQKLILQPHAELEFSFQDVPEQAIGSGLTLASIGARLRYQVSPLLGPYVGVEYDRSFGDTRTLRKAAGDAGDLSFVAGVRAWF